MNWTWTSIVTEKHWVPKSGPHLHTKRRTLRAVVVV